MSREPLLASSQDPSRRKGTLAEQTGDGRNLVAGLIRRDPGVEGDASGRSLRQFIFDPLVPAFRGHKRLLLVPDGDLALLLFEVLPTDDGGYLIDEYQISYLSAGRDLLRFTSTPVAQRAPGWLSLTPTSTCVPMPIHRQEQQAILRRSPSGDGPMILVGAGDSSVCPARR